MITSVQGLKIHYQTEGHGIPCVVPSLAGTTFYEHSFSPQLREHLQLTFVELRGNRSEVGNVSDLTTSGLADALAVFLDAIGLQKAAIIGHSGHGFLAMAFAARHPERVSHTILIGAPPNFAEEFVAERDRYWEMLASPERKRIAARAEEKMSQMHGLSSGEQIVRGYVLNSAQLWFDPNFDCSSFWEGTCVSVEIWDRFWGSGGQWRSFDAAATLPSIKCPVLMIEGLFDFVAPPTLWYRTKDMIVNHEYVLFERSGHNPQFEEPEVFNRTVLDWLRRH